MDKYEYKVRAEEIKSLIAEEAYVEAAEIADTIDWRRVKSVMMLCMISDLYKVNRRYEDAKALLRLAYEKKPGGRTICYSLCELCIKTEEFVQALNYYNEFVRVAPKDPERYILQYKIYEAQNVNLEERIGVLEELKKRDYREKWAYELAYLYHRVGLATRCVEECDELILWFGEGKYVIKAMELKMLHQPLTYAQKEIYDHRFDTGEAEDAEQYGEDGESQEYEQQEVYESQEYGQHPYEGYENGEQGVGWEGQAGEVQPEEMDIQVKPMDMGQYNTIDLQEELAAGLQEVLGPGSTGYYERDTYAEYGEAKLDDADIEGTEVFFGETGEMEEAQLEAGAGQPYGMYEGKSVFVKNQQISGDKVVRFSPKVVTAQTPSGDEAEGAVIQEPVYDDAEKVEVSVADVEEKAVLPESEETGVEESFFSGGEENIEQEQAFLEAEEKAAEENEGRAEETAAIVMRQMQEETVREDVQPPKELADVLQQETDGQIRMVLPERIAIEKQITGQMKIEDILAEWERMKKENQEKCREEVRQRVLRQTGPMFTEFEAAVRDGLLEQLEGKSQDRFASKPVERTEGGDVYTQSEEYLENEEMAGWDAGQAYGETEELEYAGGEEAEGWSEEQDIYGVAQKPEYAEEEAEPWAEEQDVYGIEEPSYAEEKEPWTGEQDTYCEGEAPGYAEEEVEAWTGEGDIYGVEEAPRYAIEAEAWTEEQDVYNEEEATEYAGEEIETWVERPDVYGVAEGHRYAEEEGESWAEEQDIYGVAEDQNAGEEAEPWAEEQDVDRVAEDQNAGEEAEIWAEEQDVYGVAEEQDAGEEAEAWAEEQDAYGVAEEQRYAGEEIETWVERPDIYGAAEEQGYVEEEAEAWAEEHNVYEEGEAPENVEEELEDQRVVSGDGENGLDNIEEIELEKESEEEPGQAKEGEVRPGKARNRDKKYAEEAEEDGSLDVEAVDFDGDEKSEALDYLEALEHVEEAELLEGESAGFEKPEDEGKADTAETNAEKPAKPSEGRGRAAMEREKAKVRSMTREEKELFAPFIQSRQSREQLVKALDNISMAAYTGNVVITGEEGMDTMTLAKNMIREIRMTDSNFLGKVAKVTGVGLNQRNVRETLEELNNGALIIQKAAGMDSKTAGMLHVALQQEKFGIIVIMEDTKKAIQKLFLGTPQLFGDFTARVDLEALSNDTLVSFGRRYAREKEFSIDDLGMLALHTRIEESQTIDHVVTVIEVKQIVDEAIRHASKKTLGHFFDILLARRYDDEDMIILTEKDFVA